MFETVGEGVVGVADLAHAETGAQVFGEVVAVAGAELRFHLQALDGFDAADVFGGEGLVACAEQELLVHPASEDRCDDEAHQGDDAHNAAPLARFNTSIHLRFPSNVLRSRQRRKPFSTSE